MTNNQIKQHRSSLSDQTIENQDQTVTLSSITTTTYDWESEKQHSKPFDDGTMTFFWRTHTITCLVIAMLYLFYVAVLEKPSDNSIYNTKR